MNQTPDNPSDINPTKTAEHGEKAFQEFRKIRNAQLSPIKPEKAYLIYHDSEEYESQLSPRIICLTRKRAEDIVAEICTFGQSLGRRLLNEFRNEDGEDVSDEVYCARVESNRIEMESAKWPHEWEANLYSDFENDYSNRPHKRFKSENLKIEELPLV